MTSRASGRFAAQDIDFVADLLSSRGDTMALCLLRDPDFTPDARQRLACWRRFKFPLGERRR